MMMIFPKAVAVSRPRFAFGSGSGVFMLLLPYGRRAIFPDGMRYSNTFTYAHAHAHTSTRDFLFQLSSLVYVICKACHM